MNLTLVAVVPVTATDRKDTLHLVGRTIERPIRAGGRKSKAEAVPLLEGIAVVVFDLNHLTLSVLMPLRPADANPNAIVRDGEIGHGEGN